jgi:hypothetical protein
MPSISLGSPKLLILDITGKDFLFGVEGLQVDKFSDEDYNDLVFSIGGSVSNGIAKFDAVSGGLERLVIATHYCTG